MRRAVVNGLGGAGGREPGIVGGFREIGEQARALSRTLTAARQSGVTGEGRDRTGALRVAVDGAGQVTSVHIDHAWSQRMGSHQLGEALLEAYREAAGEVFEAAAEAFKDADRGERHDSGVRAAREEALPYHPPTADQMQDHLDRLEAGFAELEQLKARASDTLSDSERNADRTVSSSSGLVHVSTNHGQIISVTVDEERIARISGGQVAREALAAFNAAQRTEKR